MKLILTTVKVYNIFKNYKLPIVNIADAETMENILSHRDRNELCYAVYEATMGFKEKSNPLFDVVGMLENISYPKDDYAPPISVNSNSFNTDISQEKQSYGLRTYPVIESAELVGDNTLLVVLALKGSEQDYIDTIKTTTNPEQMLSKKTAKAILGHLMCVNGLESGLALTRLKKFVFSCN